MSLSWSPLYFLPYFPSQLAFPDPGFLSPCEYPINICHLSCAKLYLYPRVSMLHVISLIFKVYFPSLSTLLYALEGGTTWTIKIVFFSRFWLSQILGKERKKETEIWLFIAFSNLPEGSTWASCILWYRVTTLFRQPSLHSYFVLFFLNQYAIPSTTSYCNYCLLYISHEKIFCLTFKQFIWATKTNMWKQLIRNE